jgi:ABC-type multidrug transport system fused ATPase/permease subunit
MKNLFLCEWRRFARVALLISVAQLVAVFLLARVTNPLHWSGEDQLALVVLFMLQGVVLAVIQIGSYRKPSQWLWLIHRPVSPQHIFLALSGAALAILSAAAFAPLLVWLLATDLLTTTVVDARHYVSLLHLLAIAAMAWLIGALAMLSRRKVVLVMFALPLVAVIQMISVWWLILPSAICVYWLFYIAMSSFRADRSASTERASALVLTVLPIQLGLFILLFHLGKASIDTANYVIRPPLASEIVTEDEAHDLDFERSAAVGLLALGLKHSTDARVASWREQLPLLPLASIQLQLERFPVRHQFGNTLAPWWDDKRGIEWTFSHDRMRYEGREPRSGASQGSWGSAGVAADAKAVPAFEQIPLGAQTRQHLYVIDIERQLQHEILHLPPAEWFVSRPVNDLGRVVVVSNLQLRTYHQHRTGTPIGTPLDLDWQIALPEAASRLVQVDIAELLDGWLVSLFYFDQYDRTYQPWQQIIHVDVQGSPQVVAERRGVYEIGIQTGVGGSPLLPTEAWWLSPLLHTLARAADSAFDKGLTRPPVFDPLPQSPRLWVVALTLMLLSLAVAHYWLRRTSTSAARRRLWLILCTLGGIPGLLSLLLLEPRTAR